MCRKTGTFGPCSNRAVSLAVLSNSVGPRRRSSSWYPGRAKLKDAGRTRRARFRCPQDDPHVTIVRARTDGLSGVRLPFGDQDGGRSTTRPQCR
jgi:hypothetical protein